MKHQTLVMGDTFAAIGVVLVLAAIAVARAKLEEAAPEHIEIDSPGWQRNYAPHRRIFHLCLSVQIRFGETGYDSDSLSGGA